MMKYVVPALGIPDEVLCWCYNSNIGRNFRLINIYGAIPKYERIKQPYKNTDDSRIFKLMENGSSGAPLYDWFSDIQLVKNVSKEKTEHPCPIPLKLAKRLILLLSEPEDLIVDPFCGSGTFCVAAKMLGRRYIGIEISEAYCKIAEQRLAGVSQDLFINIQD